MPLAGLGAPAYDRAPMTSLNRYILRQCFGVMIFVTAALSAAVWLTQSLRLIDLMVNRGLSIELFLYLSALILPRFIDVVLPIGLFIAVLFTFNRLIAESELVVMRAAGVSPLALTRAVLILAAIAFAILMSLSAYVLPVANRAFGDLQFEIRNRFVSSLIQEGTFTTVSDKLTFYIRNREANGDVVGLLINDSRDPQHPVTILAERAAFANTPSGPRIIMVNGDRQQFDPQTRKLSILTFARYTLDLDTLQDAPVVRFREAPERFLPDLFFPPKSLDRDPFLRHTLHHGGAAAHPGAALGVQLCADPAGLLAARGIQPQRAGQAGHSGGRRRLSVRNDRPRRQRSGCPVQHGDPADVPRRPVALCPRRRRADA